MHFRNMNWAVIIVALLLVTPITTSATPFNDISKFRKADDIAKTINRPCHAGTATWSNCSAPFGDLLSGRSSSLTDSSHPHTGTTDVQCNNGSLNYSSSSCQQSCASQTINWGACRDASASPYLTHGASETLNNVVGGYTGSANISCNNGTINISSSNCNAHCGTRTVNWGSGCTATVNLNHGASTGVTDPNGSGGDHRGSATVSCNNGTINVSSATCYAPCSLPGTLGGGSIDHGATRTAYQHSSRPFGSTCNSQTRTCSNGTLTGSYAHSSCTVAAPANCSLPWGGTIAHGASVTAYQNGGAQPCGGSCPSQTRNCYNGTLSGSYTNSSCSVPTCRIFTVVCRVFWNVSYCDTPEGCYTHDDGQRDRSVRSLQLRYGNDITIQNIAPDGTGYACGGDGGYRWHRIIDPSP